MEPRLQLILYFLFLQIIHGGLLDPCTVHKSCRACIRDVHLCQWCAMDNFNGTRCMASNVIKNSGCDNLSIENPKSIGQVMEDRQFSSGPIKITQIKPQEYRMTLRPGDTIQFDMAFKGAEDYPADLYFLIDASKSMESTMEAIVEASVQIYEEMKKKTKNVYLGLGTFVDKNTAPYVRGPTSNAYSFIHQIKLTEDLELFKNVVKAKGVNYDKPEGGFDALAQVITCKEEIGWREASRRIIVFLTDELYHSAGDGKWAGIVQPYDGKCYTKNGTYTKELEMDYPSVSMINKLAIDEEVTIIFAVEQTHIDRYRTLATNIRGSKTIPFKKIKATKKVVFDEKKLEKILFDIYEEITQVMRLKVYSTAPEDRKRMNITFEPDCVSNPKENPNCTVKYGTVKNFKGNIKLLQYYEKEHINIDIALEGIKERLTLKIDVADCGCETDKVKKNDEYCSYQGTKKCGICECNSNRIGDRCACTTTNTTIGSGEESCMQPNGSGIICNGFGSCICGMCKCQTGYEGTYCECNKDSCPNQCSGHGRCLCGKCILCDDGWTGDSCECSTTGCRQVNGRSCNGRGDCACGQCKCHPLASWDARYSQTPEDCVVQPCTDCHHQQCQLLKECAVCYHNYRDPHHCNLECDKGLNLYDSNYTWPNEPGEAFLCENVRMELGCYSQFQYRYDSEKYGVDVLVFMDKNCQESYYVYGGIFLGSLLLIGILTLVAWKLLTDMRDKREYERFLKAHEADMAGPSINPIYEPATTTFRNPAFRKPSVDNVLK